MHRISKILDLATFLKVYKATCQEYGCCWANDAVSRGYQCYKDRSDILDGAGLGCLVDKPPGCDTFEEYNRTTSDVISMWYIRVA